MAATCVWMQRSGWGISRNHFAVHRSAAAAVTFIITDWKLLSCHWYSSLNLPNFSRKHMSLCMFLSSHLSSNIGMRLGLHNHLSVLTNRSLFNRTKQCLQRASYTVHRADSTCVDRTTHPSRCTGAAAIITLFTDIYHLCYRIPSQDTIDAQRWQTEIILHLLLYCLSW